MNALDLLSKCYEFNRGRTLGLLDAIEKEADPMAALAWRPGPARAHIGWQLMHIAVTEEIFATERLAHEKPGKWATLWPRFRGGSKPDDDAPSPATLRQVLSESRSELLATLATLSEERLNEIPPALRERQWTLLTALEVISWHEGHHQGQAHITLNLYKARSAERR